ncbi:glycine betaine ABC transporter substrate-binding protein [Actinomadura sp. DC4]|uniref:glycine betaine ABC transporter substrate-binding protein n=1 Tax=Actinomadura sp. DC4 TaxID=3055069 RepID=UPI0025B20B39|nr:glycine betaine ABC transporter substrate-binding protein [Actinomadura sp. DC4]MDN3356920.1 glycine betaine ABC transporter substrate-binding protein [Actinomadura sp. DC4]
MRQIDPLRAGDPERIGPYRLTGRLGEGGQGVVYRAAGGDGVPVALKVLHPRLIRGAQAYARLGEEITMVRRVADFCTARVHELATDGARSYVVSEYVDGPSLWELVERDGPLGGGALARLIVGTASALAAIHRAGVLHRDFTPHNVLIGPDGPRVIDFGIARALDSAATVTSGLVGTPAYAAPELLRGEHHTPAADIFGWAVSMTFAATGRPAFGTDSVAAVFHRILHDEPDVSAVPPPYREVLARCLDKDPRGRPAARDILLQLLGYQDVEAASSAIELPEGIRGPDRLTIDRGVPPENLTRPDRFTRPDRTLITRRRWFRPLVAGCAAVIAGAAVLTYVLWPGGSPGRAATPPVPAPAVTVGSADFAESALLGEVYAQALESRGYRVTRRFGLGDRETYFEQVRSGQIDVIPEYLGALAVSLAPSSDAATGAEVERVLARVLPPQLELLRSAAAEDKDTVTVTRTTADRYGLRSIADLKPVAGKMILGGSPEFEARHLGVVGLRGPYGLNFRDFQPFATSDRATMIGQLKDGRIQAANLFSTEPAIAQNDFVVLADPKNLFSAQNVTPLVYRSSLSATGRAALDAVSARLTTADLLRMNVRIVDGVTPGTVAADWLRSHGLGG